MRNIPDHSLRHPYTAACRITAPMNPVAQSILTEDAVRFLIGLHRHFNQARKILLLERTIVQHQINHGWKPYFLPETKDTREGNWVIAPVPDDLQDRRVEITGPVERKMVINALNSGAKIFMADFEDSNTPSWYNIIQGQFNFKDDINGTISYSG